MVNPEGGEVVACRFEYGPSEAYGAAVPCSSSPGSGSGPVAVSASVAGLASNSSYHFRVVAANAGGTSYGSDGSFKTLAAPPTVVSVSPKRGHAAGGASVAIGGSNFIGVLAVKFGANAASSVTVNSPTSISAVAPAGPRGRVDVVVVTETGSSPVSKKDRFKYIR
jgi:hypothetical protein